MKQPGSESLPLRPLTTGELLDASVSLLRRGALRLLPLAAVLAIAEQFALLPLRHAARVGPPWYFPPYNDRGASFWLLLAVGFGIEGAILTVLGSQAARLATPALAGVSVARPAARPGATAALALIIGLAGAVAFAAGGLPWVVWFMLTTMAGPVLIADRVAVAAPAGPPVPGGPPGWRAGVAYRPMAVFPALVRAIVLAARSGQRPGAIRMLGYLAWWAVRLALAAGTVKILELVATPSHTLVTALSIATWALVNTIAYAVLGCLDAAIHLETRMRTEGLDIALSQALRASGGAPTAVPAALAVPR